MALSPLEAAGQVLVAGYPSTDIDGRLAEELAHGQLGGLIFFARNINSAQHLHSTIQGLRFDADRPPLLAIDQEGGRVARLGAPVVQLPPMRELGANESAELTQEAGQVLGKQLRAIGLTMNFAPVLDVHTNDDNPVIGDRAFGTTPEVVIRHALAFAEGMRQAGLLACGKHFPGHGDTHLDSHLALPVITHDRSRVDAVELAPFRAALHLPAMMTAHVVFNCIDLAVPATLSRHVIAGLLREELGYDGCIISDDLEMNAVREQFGVVESGLRAIEAGCDLLLVCSDVEALFALRVALAKRATEDDSFLHRLRDAAARSLKLRRSAPPRPALSLDSVFDDSAPLQARLESP